MTLTSFFLQTLVTLLTLALVVYLPGRLLIRVLKLELSDLENVAASVAVGLAAFVLVFWGLSALHWQRGLWLYLLISVVELSLKYSEHRRSQLLPPNPDLPPREGLRPYWPLGLLVLLGSLLQMRFTAATAWLSDSGMQLLAWHAHDAPWHLFNIFQMANNFPPAMPGFSGRHLQNYHMFSDLLWGGVQRISQADPWHLYFRVAPLLYSGLLTVGAFLAGQAWSGRKRTAYLAAILTVFASNFGFLMPWLFGFEKYFLWDSVFWVQSPFGLIFNPGVSSSFGLVLVGIWALARWLHGRQWGFLVLLALIWGVLPGFKVYPGLLLLSGLAIGGLWMFLFQKNSGLLTAFFCTLPVFLLVFIPPVLHAPSLVRILPGYNLGAMLVAPDRMQLMSSADFKLLFLQKPWLVALMMAGLALVFLVGNLGVRSLGLVPLVRNLLKPRESEPIQLLIAIVVAEALGASILLVQSGVQWNTIQFFYYAVLLASLPASQQFWDWCGRWRSPKPLLAAGLLVAVSLPGTVQSLAVIRFHYDMSPAAMAGLNWIRTHSKPGQCVLRPLPDALMTAEGWRQFERNQERGRMTSMKAWQADARAVAAAGENTGTAQSAAAGVPAANTATAVASLLPAAMANTATAAVVAAGTPPLEHTDAAIVAAVTQRNTYLEDTVSAQIMGYPMEDRARQVLHFYYQADVVAARDFLEKENISYVILYPGMRLPFDPAGVPLKKEFENQAMTIYKYIFLGGW